MESSSPPDGPSSSQTQRLGRPDKRPRTTISPSGAAMTDDNERNSMPRTSSEATSSRPLFMNQGSARPAYSRLFTVQRSSSSRVRKNSHGEQIAPSSSSAAWTDLNYVRQRHNTETPAINTHLLERALKDGRHSDITVIAFETSYCLHRIILDRAPYFASALSPPWLESSTHEIHLHPEETDANITQRAFDLALKRLYGTYDLAQEEPERFGLLAVGCWLEMQDLINDSVAAILRSLHTGSLPQAIQMMTASCYGVSGDQILQAANLILNREGSQLPARYWDGIPAEVVRQAISDDSFFAKSEYERWVLARDILNLRLHSLATSTGMPTKGGKLCRAPRWIRKYADRMITYRGRGDDTDSEGEMTDQSKPWVQLYTHPDIQPLFTLLDRGIYYVHLDYDQLQQIKMAVDYFGVPVVPEKILSGALWDGLELRQRILTAKGRSSELGLSKQGRPALTSFLKLNTSPPATAIDSVESPCSSLGGSPRRTEDNRAIDPSSKAPRHWIPHFDCNYAYGAYSALQNIPDKNTPDKKHIADVPIRDVGRPPQSPDEEQAACYSRLPPFRFAAEFPHPQSLTDRRRIYSDSFFYAGSHWNIYIQKLAPSTRNKTRARLGFYLHRVRPPPEVEELSETVGNKIQQLEQGMLMRSHGNEDRPWSSYGPVEPQAMANARRAFGQLGETENDEGGLGSIRAAMRPLMAIPHRASLGPSTTPAPIALFDSHAAESTPDSTSRVSQHNTMSKRKYPHTIPPYVDARPTVKAYFKIYSPSPTGRLMNMYQSVPDDFNFSQSWGWKSSSMLATCEEEDMGCGAFGTGMRGAWDAEDEGAMSRKLATLELDTPDNMENEREKHGEGEAGAMDRHGKLRFMVVLGVV